MSFWANGGHPPKICSYLTLVILSEQLNVGADRAAHKLRFKGCASADFWWRPTGRRVAAA
jgi:hypothetical protein